MAEEYIEDGFVLLSRKIFSSKTFSSLNAIQKLITIYLILMANHKDNEWWDNYHKKFITIKRGSFITSIEGIRKKINDKLITTKKIRLILSTLSKMDFLAIKTASGYSHITILKYNLYQGIINYKGKQKGNDRARVGQAKGKGRATNNNGNNDKNDNKKREREPAVFLTEEEYQKLVIELGDPLTKEYMKDLSLHILSKGKEKYYKSHYATILAWHRKDEKEGKVRKPQDSEVQPKHIFKPEPKFTPEQIKENLAKNKAIMDKLKGGFKMPETAKGGKECLSQAGGQYKKGIKDGGKGNIVDWQDVLTINLDMFKQ